MAKQQTIVKVPMKSGGTCDCIKWVSKDGTRSGLKLPAPDKMPKKFKAADDKCKASYEQNQKDIKAFGELVAAELGAQFAVEYRFGSAQLTTDAPTSAASANVETVDNTEDLLAYFS